MITTKCSVPSHFKIPPVCQKFRLDIEGQIDENTIRTRTRTIETKHRRTVGRKSKNENENVSPLGLPQVIESASMYP